VISGVTQDGVITVSVSKSGYTISPSQRAVNVYYNHILSISLESITPNSGSNTTELIITFSGYSATDTGFIQTIDPLVSCDAPWVNIGIVQKYNFNTYRVGISGSWNNNEQVSIYVVPRPSVSGVNFLTPVILRKSLIPPVIIIGSAKAYKSGDILYVNIYFSAQIDTIAIFNVILKKKSNTSIVVTPTSVVRYGSLCELIIQSSYTAGEYIVEVYGSQGDFVHYPVVNLP